MKVEVEGLAELAERLDQMSGEIREAAARAVADETDEIRDDARRSAPVDTGELAEGIQAEANGLAGTVTSTADHGIYVEFGTSSMPARPYMQPAAERARRRFPKIVAELTREAL